MICPQCPHLGDTELGWSDTDLYAVLEQASVLSDTRPEQVSVDQFCETARAAKARDI
jgi:hypothetical protein